MQLMSSDNQARRVPIAGVVDWNEQAQPAHDLLDSIFHAPFTKMMKNILHYDLL